MEEASAAMQVKQVTIPEVCFSADAVCNADVEYPYRSRSRWECEEQYEYGLALAQRCESALRVADDQTQ